MSVLIFRSSRAAPLVAMMNVGSVKGLGTKFWKGSGRVEYFN